MQVELLLMGKIKEDHILQGTRYYSDKLQHFCKLTIHELGVKESSSNPSQIIAAESEVLHARLKDGHAHILLDQRDKRWTALVWPANCSIGNCTVPLVCSLWWEVPTGSAMQFAIKQIGYGPSPI